MAIVMRQGEYADFVPSKMRPGEWAVVLADDPVVPDGKSVFIAFAAGNVKRMATYEDMKDLIGEAAGDIRNQYIDIFDDLKDQYIIVFNGIKNEAKIYCDRAAGYTNDSKNQADISKSYADAADASRTAAADSATQAAQSAGVAADFSKESESHSHGGTGTRPGEDTDNSLYYSQLSRLEYERAKEEADRAEKFSGFVKPQFLLLNNRLYLKRGSTVEFIAANNRMYYKIGA